MKSFQKLTEGLGRQRRKDQVPPSPANELSESSTQDSSPKFPDGVEVWHDCSGATVDICFIHGLTGDRTSTWTARGESIPWPKTLLPLELHTARILTYGYDAYVVRNTVAGTNNLLRHANNLLNDLTTDRSLHNSSTRPLLFVTHSLDGLVCKKAILLSRGNPEAHLRGIFNCTKGIIFMGTPHKGSWMAKWASLPASALSLMKSTNTSLLKILKTDNQLLEDIQNDFLLMIRELRERNRRLEVTCFYEELPLPGCDKVVSEESATLEGYNSLSIHANHSDMVRFSSASDNGFRRLLGELHRWKGEVNFLRGQTSLCRERQAKRSFNGSDENPRKRRRTARGDYPQVSRSG